MAELAGTVLVCEWGSETWRSRRVRIAPCPEAGKPTRLPFCGHDLTVADCFEDELSHVFCSCGWVGSGHATEEQAVEAHNTPHGFGIEPVSDWETSERAFVDDEELPF